MRAAVLRVLAVGGLVLGLTQASLVSGAKPGTGVLRGTVRDLSGPALPFADVRVNDSPLRGTTDRTGAFVIPDVPPGRHGIRVLYMGYEEQTIFVEVVAGETTGVDFDLQEGELLDEPTRLPGEGASTDGVSVTAERIELPPEVEIPRDSLSTLAAVDVADCDSLQIVFGQSAMMYHSMALLYATAEPRLRDLHDAFPFFYCSEPPGMKKWGCQWARVSPGQAKFILDLIRENAPVRRGIEAEKGLHWLFLYLELVQDGKSLTYETYLTPDEAKRILGSAIEICSGPLEPGGVEYALRWSGVGEGMLSDPPYPDDER